MNLLIMRKTDSAVGVPLCFLLTLWRRLAGFFSPSSATAADPVRKILLIKLSEMGAITLTYPLLSYLRKEYPGATIAFLVFEKNATALNLLKEAIDPKNIYPVKDDSFWALVTSSVRALSRIRRERFDVVMDLEFFSRCTSVMTYLAGGKKSAGYFRYHFEGLYRGDLLTHKVQYNPLIHCSRVYLSLGKVLRAGSMDSPEIPEQIRDEELVFPRFDPVPRAIEAMHARLRSLGVPTSADNIYLVNPGDGLLPVREWPLENFVKLAEKLLLDPRNAVIIVGRECITSKDVLMHKAVNHPRCINLVDKTSFEEIMALFHMARAMVTNDCGLPHLASMTRVKRVVIFGPESPQVFAPVGPETRIVYSHYPCSPCFSVLNHRNSSCQDNHCLKSIPVEQVYVAAMSEQ